jgi:glucose-1-phosphate thymidylyltransferase
VSGSRIVGPVVIGAGARIIDSYIGPFSAIGADCVIEDIEIEYSLVLRGARGHDFRRIGASLIGRHAQVIPAPRVPKVRRLALGDHSVVQISS